MFDHVAWLTGMPRSGTTWLAQIMASSPSVRLKYCPLFSYEFKNRCDEQSSPAAWDEFFRQVYVTPGEYLDQTRAKDEGLIPTFPPPAAPPPALGIKSNRYHHLTRSILQKCPSVYFAALVRHPAATLHSWITNPLEFPAGADWRDHWRTGACRKTGVGEFWGFDDWLSVTAEQVALAEEFPARLRIFRYEDFERAPAAATAALFAHLRLEDGPQTEAFLVASRTQHSDHRRSVFKRTAHASRWRADLPASVQAEIEERTREAGLAAFLEEAQS